MSSRDSFTLAKTRRFQENVCSINSHESALQTSFHKRPAERADGAIFLCLIGFAAFPLGWKPEPWSQQILLLCILNLSLLRNCMIGYSGETKENAPGAAVLALFRGIKVPEWRLNRRETTADDRQPMRIRADFELAWTTGRSPISANLGEFPRSDVEY